MSAPSKLTPEQGEEIRRLHASGTSVADLASRFGVSTPTIYNRLKAKPPRLVPVVPSLCGKPQCGTDEPSPVDALPIAVTDYRSRLGAVLRFCTWHCLSRHAIRAELAGGDA